MAGLQSGEGRMMIDLIIWAQYVNVTDRHIAIANAARTHWQKLSVETICTFDW